MSLRHRTQPPLPSRSASDSSGTDTEWTRLPPAPNPYAQQAEGQVGRPYSDSSDGRYRGRSSDPESPPSGRSPEEEAHMKDFPLSSGGIGVSAVEYKEEQRPLISRGVLWVTALVLVCWMAAFFFYRQPSPLPRTMVRQKKVFGEVLQHEHYIDIKLCEESHCFPGCEQVEQARHSALRSHESMAELQSRHTDAMRIHCDREYYIGIEVCKNPGELVSETEWTGKNVIHAPFYSLYHDADGLGKKPKASELCSRQYPERPLHFNFEYPTNTSIHIAVCADGKDQPVVHEFKCI